MPREGTMLRIVMRILCDRRGATAIEYGLIAALIAVAIISGAAHVGADVAGVFTTLAGAM